MSLFWSFVFIGLFIYSMKKDRRRLINGVYLFCGILCLYAATLDLISQAFPAYQYSAMILWISIPLSMVLVPIFLIINFFFIIKREGATKAAFVPLIFAFIILGSLFLPMILSSYSYLIGKSIILKVAYYLGILAFLIAVYSGFAFVIFTLYTFLYRAIPKGKQFDYIIVHGAGLIGQKVSPLLARRLDKAMEVYHQDPDGAMFIVSGGQGADEEVSEAWAMKQYLLEHGIQPEMILLEDQSTTTYENLLYSKKIMDQRNPNPYLSVFVTNDYHVLRTGMYAREVGLKSEGIGCYTALYYLPSAYIREFIAILVKYRKPYYFIGFLWILMVVVSHI